MTLECSGVPSALHARPHEAAPSLSAQCRQQRVFSPPHPLFFRRLRTVIAKQAKDAVTKQMLDLVANGPLRAVRLSPRLRLGEGDLAQAQNGVWRRDRLAFS